MPVASAIPSPEDPEPAAPTALADPWLVSLASQLAAAGFDLVATCAVSDYDDRVPDEYRFASRTPDAEPPAIAPDISRDDRVVLIGASRAIWPAFTAALSQDPSRRHDAHPFDRWSSEVIASIVARSLPPARVLDLRMVFEGPPHAFAALQLAEATGLACRGPASLSVHPRYGPWFALRAALVIRGDGSAWPQPLPPDPICQRCPTRGCLPAMDHALAESRRPPDTVQHEQVRERWRLWLAVRDACPVGREYRYSENQIRWHYAHDRSALA